MVNSGAAYNGTFTLVNPGWTLAVSGIHLVADAASQSTHQVCFKDWNGITIGACQAVPDGGSATAPANPARDGFIFDGWDKAFDNVRGDLTVTAVYKNATGIIEKHIIPARGFGIAIRGQSFQITGTPQATPVRIYNLRGGVLLNRVAAPSESVSFAHLPRGVYMLKAGGQTFRLKR